LAKKYFGTIQRKRFPQENMGMWHFVYILKNQQGIQYIGHTQDLNARLREHNEGRVDATKQRRPWHFAWFCAYQEKKAAIAFEKHVKTGSGSAFRFRHFVPKEKSRA
jgi:putative endonuclease